MSFPRVAILVVCVFVPVSATASLGATAHRSGCHGAHTCPSDHHSYIWYDGGGKGWDCAEPGAPEVGVDDTTVITYEGLRYYCHAAGTGGSSPPPSTAPEPVVGGTGTSQLGVTVSLGPRTRTSACRLGTRPDRRCSPGGYYSRLTTSVICDPRFRAAPLHHVTEAQRFAVEREYGLEPARYGTSLQIDHIVPVELGGSNDIANLFPQRANAHGGYRNKDRLEDRLHLIVCAGRMNLGSARRQIAVNWETLYKKVFGVAP